MIKKAWLTILTILLAFPLHAQHTQDSVFIFHFRPGNDFLHASYQDNEKELQRLADVLEQQRKALENGIMYIHVNSYATTDNGKRDATRIAYLRNSRIKSELIVRYRITEQMFLTDKHTTAPYGSEKLRNVVVVTFPATLEKIEQIAGNETANKIRAYYKKQMPENTTNETAPKIRPTESQETQSLTVSEKPSSQTAQESQSENVSAQTKITEEYPFTKIALRANLLRWATLTPDLGVEWRINHNWSVLVNGSWTSWSWDDKNRRYALWEVSPEVRWYLGKEKRGYLGAMYKAGSFNYKFSETGRQGDLMGGGLTGGYRLKLNRSFDLDFTLGVGCLHADYEKYTVTDGVRVKQGEGCKNYWGVTNAGITLVWKLK